MHAGDHSLLQLLLGTCCKSRSVDASWKQVAWFQMIYSKRAALVFSKVTRVKMIYAKGVRQRNIVMVLTRGKAGNTFVPTSFTPPRRTRKKLSKSEDMGDEGYVQPTSEECKNDDHSTGYSFYRFYRMSRISMQQGWFNILQLLAFMNHGNDLLIVDGADETISLWLNDLMEKLIAYSIHDFKDEVCSSSMLEYCVPVQMPLVQVHEYCNLLLQNYEVLQSGHYPHQDISLHDVLLKLREVSHKVPLEDIIWACCNHPYIVSSTLQGSIMKHVAACE